MRCTPRRTPRRRARPRRAAGSCPRRVRATATKSAMPSSTPSSPSAGIAKSTGISRIASGSGNARWTSPSTTYRPQVALIVFTAVIGMFSLLTNRRSYSGSSSSAFQESPYELQSHRSPPRRRRPSPGGRADLRDEADQDRRQPHGEPAGEAGRAAAAVEARVSRRSFSKLSARPSSISAMRYRICPLRYAVFPAQPGCATRTPGPTRCPTSTSGRRSSAPVPSPMARGSPPSRAAIVVIMIGRKRMRHP